MKKEDGDLERLKNNVKVFGKHVQGLDEETGKLLADRRGHRLLGYKFVVEGEVGLEELEIESPDIEIRALGHGLDAPRTETPNAEVREPGSPRDPLVRKKGNGQPRRRGQTRVGGRQLARCQPGTIGEAGVQRQSFQLGGTLVRRGKGHEARDSGFG